MKNIYAGVAAALSVFALTGVLFYGLGHPATGVVLVGVAIALVPVVQHLLMRRQTASIKRMIKASSPTAETLQAVQKSASSIGNTSRTLRTALEDLRRKNEELQSAIDNLEVTSGKELTAYANELRRESRMLRLVATELNNKYVQEK